MPFTVCKDRFIPLNLPPIRAFSRQHNGSWQIYDVFRRKYVALTPEEWVRQHFLHYLHEALGYPKEAIAVEVPVEGALRTDRADALVYGPGAKLQILLEFKAPEVELSQKTVEQISRYNLFLKAPWLVLSNGLRHLALHFDEQKEEFCAARHIPSYQSFKDQI